MTDSPSPDASVSCPPPTAATADAVTTSAHHLDLLLLLHSRAVDVVVQEVYYLLLGIDCVQHNPSQLATTMTDYFMDQWKDECIFR